jgi:hypothetical protein
MSLDKVESSNPNPKAAHAEASTQKTGTCNRMLRMPQMPRVFQVPRAIPASPCRAAHAGRSGRARVPRAVRVTVRPAAPGPGPRWHGDPKRRRSPLPSFTPPSREKDLHGPGPSCQHWKPMMAGGCDAQARGASGFQADRDGLRLPTRILHHIAILAINRRRARSSGPQSVAARSKGGLALHGAANPVVPYAVAVCSTCEPGLPPRRRSAAVDCSAAWHAAALAETSARECPYLHESSGRS